MKISIDELLTLISSVQKDAENKYRELIQGAYKESVQETILNEVKPERFNELFFEWQKLKEYLRFLNTKLNEANHNAQVLITNVENDNVKMNITEAISYVKDLQQQINLEERLSKYPQKEILSGYGSSENIIKSHTHDIDNFKLHVRELKKIADRISRAITRTSVSYLLEVEDAEKYM